MPECDDRIVFGDYVFVASLGLLERDSHAVVLPEQAAKVLAQLLERNGELVTREALCRTLWPDVKVNEYDQGINNVVSRLRWHLRDNAQKPRYIETIPKRGYRFLAAIEYVPSAATAEEPVIQEPTFGADAPAKGLLSAADSNLVLGSIEPVGGFAGNASHFFRLPWLKIWLAATCLLLLLAGGFAAVRRSRIGTATGSRDLTTIAVAPFQVPGDDAATVQLADSLRLDLMNSLSQLPAIRVKASHAFPAPASTMTQRPANPEQLGVDEFLFVQIHRDAGEYVADLELVKADGLSHIASWQYKGSPHQLNGMMQKARDDVFTASRGERQQRPAHGGTNTPEAYEVYLHARYHAHQRLPEPLKTAVQEYQQAIRLDPGFANAYAGLADTYVALGDYSADSQSHAYQLAQDAVRRAIALDPSLAEAHALFGYLAFRKDWNFSEGEAQLRQAIRLDDAQASYHLWLSIMLTDQRRFQEAAHEIDKAKEADPFWPPVYGDEAYLEANLHEFGKLSRTIDTLVNLKPDWSGTYDDRAWAYWLSGHEEEAVAEWRRMAVMDHDQKRIDLEDRGMAALMRGGPRAYARLRYEAATSGTVYLHADSDFRPAEWAAYMGDYTTTLRLLDQMVLAHDIACLEMSVNSAFIPLYGNPAFLGLLARVGLPAPLSKAAS